MGPIVILDKSAFQSFSRREHTFLRIHFEQNLTPILAMELLGDLSKGAGEEPTKEVTELTGKFGGSGPVTNLDYQTLCFKSLLGEPVPLDGRIITDNFTAVPRPNGSWGGLIDQGPFNDAILRWSQGEFSEFEHIMARYWRKVTRDLNMDDFIHQLDSRHVIIPHVDDSEGILPTAEGMLMTAGLQDVWLDWLLSQLALPDPIELAILLKWKTRHNLLLKDFAPYASYCLRVLLVLLIATRVGHVRWQPTNLLDVQYMYYLPFCMVFSSNDSLHKSLAPLIMREDQSFVGGEDLKADLRRLAAERDRLTETERSMLSWALGSHPPPAKDSIVYELWKRHLRPWKPGMGNMAIALSEEEKKEALRRAEKLFREAEDDGIVEGEDRRCGLL